MLKVLAPKLPAGLPLQEAQHYMISQGFQIADKKDSMFKGKGPFNFLLCTREDGDPPIRRHWEVAIIYDSQHVSSVLCRTAIVYP
jgi:hypothetical protein